MKYIHGGDIYDKNIRLDFSVSLNPLGCPESVKSAVSDSMQSVCVYPDIRYDALRECIAGYETERYAAGKNIDKEMIIPGSGASELIMAAAHVFAGKKVLINLPVFAGYERAFENAGCVIEYSYPEDEDKLISKISDTKPDLVVVGSPANPTGQVIGPDLMNELVSACKDAGCTLLCDEAFMGFVVGRKNYSFAKYLSEEYSLIIIRSFTKLYSCPGLRMGYVVCPDALLAERIASHLPEWNISLPAEKAMAALCGEDDFADKSAEYVSEEREYMMCKMSKMGINVSRSDANYIFFRAGDELYDRLLEKGILIRNCRDYKGLGGKGAFRIGIRDRLENDELLSALKEILCQKI